MDTVLDPCRSAPSRARRRDDATSGQEKWPDIKSASIDVIRRDIRYCNTHESVVEVPSPDAPAEYGKYKATFHEPSGVPAVSFPIEVII
jgi:hypothetical protein